MHHTQDVYDLIYAYPLGSSYQTGRVGIQLSRGAYH